MSGARRLNDFWHDACAVLWAVPRLSALSESLSGCATTDYLSSSSLLPRLRTRCHWLASLYHSWLARELLSTHAADESAAWLDRTSHRAESRGGGRRRYHRRPHAASGALKLPPPPPSAVAMKEEEKEDTIVVVERRWTSRR